MEIKYLEYGSKEYEESVELRISVLRRPWGRGMVDEERAFEKAGAPVIAAIEENKVIGVGVIKPIDEENVEIRYMAVHPDHQGRGVGHQIMDEIESYIDGKCFKKILLSARTNILPFYEKRGYKIIGKPYIPDFVPVEHIEMEKKL